MTGPITLASGSAIRRDILKNAGVAFDVEKPRVDERTIKAAMPDACAESVAQALADEKSIEVSRRTKGIVVGADQVLRFEGRLYDKARSMTEARDRLFEMAGAAHDLVGAIAIARDGEVVRRHCEISTMHMRSLSDGEIDAYLKRAGEGVLSSVGCYQYENLGAQLFDRVEGDYFAILGLPLIPLLAMLRAEDATPG